MWSHTVQRVAAWPLLPAAVHLAVPLRPPVTVAPEKDTVRLVAALAAKDGVCSMPGAKRTPAHSVSRRSARGGKAGCGLGLRN
jgi:hypothetical protein